jgi:uncharacterized protein
VELARGFCQTGGMNADPISTWLGFLASPAAPKTAMPPVELDGYLTGIAVSPDLLLPSRWLGRLWGDDEPLFDDERQLQTVINAVMDRYNTIIAALDTGFEQLEAKQPIAYRPLFLAGSDRPNHDVVRTWVRGFGKAMALAPEGWIAIAEDERLQPLLSPLAGFMDPKDPDFVPAENIEELLDEAAADIPRVVVLLRKVAQFSNQNQTARRNKIRRNDPCPCGSGLKYKRCCGDNQSNLN